MTAEQLQQLKEAFNADYNPQKVIGALDVAFGEEIDKKNISSTDYAQKYQNEATAANIVESVKLIGYYDNQNIYVFDITLKPNCHIARARVGIKRLVTQLMDNYSYAILLFHYDEDATNKEWRISWVTKSSGNTHTNAAKRYTFLCGAMHPSRTIVERLSQISQSKLSVLPDKITDAFSVETLSDEFFDEYKAFYEDIVQYICGSRYVKEGNGYVRKPIEDAQTIFQRGIFKEFIKQVPNEITDEEKRTEAAEKLVRDYVKKLLGRLVFIQFIAKKGWMGLKQDNDWGEGNEHFLLNLYKNASQQDKNDFVQNILKSILFDSLNNNPNGQTDQFGVKINTKNFNSTSYKFPYLNGGLFEETALDKVGINIPGYFFVSNEKDSRGMHYLDDDKNAPKNTPRKFVEVAKKKSKKKNSEEIENTPYPYNQSEGLFEFFERYNFTIDENDSDEAIVGIDPEMLGKIFENLLEDNKDKGAFYTPKPVVEYMCQQSIIAYLQNGVLKAKSASSDKSSDSSKKVIAALSAIPYDEIKSQIEQFVKTKSLPFTNSVESRQGLREVGIKSGEETEGKCMSIEMVSLLNKLLKDVKICDPAIGSGAFPMGLLNELLACREALQSRGGVQKTSKQLSRAELKKEIIQNNIYGVDIEEGAIEIARLRFWLSIVIDLDRPEPLPNFDFKFMQGNSLMESYQFEIESENKNETKKKSVCIDFSKLCEEKNEYVYDKCSMIPFVEGNEERKDLMTLLQEYYDTTDHDAKRKLRDNIEKQARVLLNAKCTQSYSKYIDDMSLICDNFFLWHLWFKDVFDNGGFDIVIGNPPYISTKGVTAVEKRIYKKEFGFSDDLYNLFTFKGIELTKQGGSLTYIIPKTFWTIQTKRNMRDLLLSKSIRYIYDTANPFKTVMVDTCVIQTINTDYTEQHRIEFIDGSNDTKEPVTYKPVLQATYIDSPDSVIFVPSDKNLRIQKKYGNKIKVLYDQWWEKVKTSRDVEKNKILLEQYRQSLKPGDIALLGCLTEGGQGLATANNGKYVAVRIGTKWADNVYESRPKKLRDALSQHPQIAELIGNVSPEEFLLNSTEKQIADTFDTIKERFGRDIFGQGYLYKLIDDSNLADIDSLTDDEKGNGIDTSKPYYVPYDKGDKDGNRWYLKTPYAIAWSKENVRFLKTNSGKKGTGMPVVRNPQFYFREGFCWSDINSTYLKCRKKQKSINDVTSMSMFGLCGNRIPETFFVCMINSSFMSEYVDDFVNNTSIFQINDARQLPIIIPTESQLLQFSKLFDDAVKIKQTTNSQADLDLIQQQLDDLVWKLYME